MKGRVEAVCSSERRGPKEPAESILLRRGQGVVGDVHAGTWHRQVSLLAAEDIDEARKKMPELAYGAFGENIIVRGLPLDSLHVGRRFRAGDESVLQVTQIGKVCHDRCVIYHTLGDCIMPRKGIFARVVASGSLEADDEVTTDASLDRYRYAVVTVSDRGTSGEREDASGPLVAELVQASFPAFEVSRELIPDDRKAIEELLVQLCDDKLCDLVLTTGGTGLSPRDVTPEATAAVIDREVPGMADAVRAAGLAKTPHAMLSRALCGQRGHTLVINLSGSPKAVREQLEVLQPVLPHALETATGIPQDCGAREVPKS